MPLHERESVQLKRLAALFALAAVAAAPVFGAITLSDVAVTDLTPRSFVVLVRADRQISVSVTVYADAMGTQPVAGVTAETQFTVSGNTALATAAQTNGLMRVRVRGLEGGKSYFYRTTVTPVGGSATPLPAAPPYPSFTTPRGNFPVDNPSVGIVVNQPSGNPTDGTLVVVEVDGRVAPVTQMVGDGYPSNTAAVNLNNVFEPESTRNSQTTSGTSVNLAAQGGLRGRAATSASLPPGEEVGTIWFASTPLTLGGAFDADGDGMPDEFELRFGLNPAVNDAALDGDSDGLTNLQEYQLGTRPNDSDTDNDGLLDGAEVGTHNTLATQSDTDRDGLTDAQEINNYNTNPRLRDSDNDGTADAEEIAGSTDPNNPASFPILDPDGDGVGHTTDNCLTIPNPDQLNSDTDAFGDACDTDDDNDGVLDANDNAPKIPNANQADGDFDGIGNVADNCPAAANPQQTNHDSDSLGDACDDDDDNDGIFDFGTAPAPSDIAYLVTNILDVTGTTVPVQTSGEPFIYFYKFDRLGNRNIKLGSYDLKRREWAPETLDAASQTIEGGLMIARDPLGCACMNYPAGSRIELETDRGPISVALAAPAQLPAGALRFVAMDGSLYSSYFTSLTPLRLANLVYSGAIAPRLDNCQFVPNPAQEDIDDDGKGDLCDTTPNDLDGDDVPNASDNCPNVHNVDQANADGDAFGNACDADADGDGIANTTEVEQLGTDPFAADSNGDGIADENEDFDFDGVGNRAEIARGSNPLIPETDLRTGLNLVHFPMQPAADFSAFDLLGTLGGSAFVSRIERVTPGSEAVPAAYYDGASPAGVDFTVTNDAAYMIVMLQPRRQVWTGESLCRSVHFVEGKQLIGFGCVNKGMTAHGMLEALGAGAIASMQRLNPKTKRFDTVAYDGDAKVGRDFQLNGIAGYLAHLRQNVSTELFNLRAPGLTLDGLADGQVVSDPNLLLTGSVSDSLAHVLVNGRTARLTPGSSGASFSLSGLNLVEGDNTLEIRVRGANNMLLSRTITVRYAVPPVLTIQSHLDGQETPSASTTVQGTVGDPGAVVTVNGVNAPVTGGVYEVSNIPLALGQNAIEVVATGTNGGVARKRIVVSSRPVYIMLPSGDRTRIVEMFLSDSQYAAGTMFNFTYRGGSAFTFTNNAAVRTAPNTWRFNFTVGTTSSTPQGETDFIVTYRVLTTALAVVRTEDIRVRVAQYSSVLVAFDQSPEGSVTQSSSLQLAGRVVGLGQSLTVNGASAALGGTTPSTHVTRAFSETVPLQLGRNYIELAATATNGTVYRTELLVTRDGGSPLKMEITSPRAKDVLDGATALIRGTVSRPEAAVMVNGVTATVTPSATGAIFEAMVPIVDGANKIQALASFGSDRAGDQVLLYRAPFSLRLQVGYDHSTMRRLPGRFIGIASVPLQSVTINGTVLNVNGNRFNSDGLFTINSVALGDSMYRFPLTATTMAGDTVTLNLYLKYEPFRPTTPNPGRARVSFDVDVPDDLPPITQWARPTSVTYSVNLRHHPFPGRVEPSTVEQLSAGRYRLWADVEAHGQPLASGAQVAAETWSLRGADGTELYSATQDFAWILDTKPTYRAVFITSISNGDRTYALQGTTFGLMPNIQAQSVTINDAPAQFNSTEFWDIESVWARGAHEITVRVVATDGEVFTDTVNFTTEPQKFTLPLIGGTVTIDFRMHQNDDVFRNSGFNFIGRPTWMPFPVYDVVFIEQNTSYFRTPRYYYMTYHTRWNRAPNQTLPEPFSGYGIHEVLFENEYQFWAWPNYVPNGVPVQIEMVSHTEGQDVSGANAIVRIKTANHGYSDVTINGIPAVKSFDYSQCCLPSIRVETTHTATVPLLLGTNTITVTASGPTPGNATFTLNRTH
jgi:hypothetical protein